MVDEIESIKERNKRVERDKAWETSWTRRIFIVVATYVVSTIWLFVIDEPNPLLKALIPAIGYILSTLSIETLKNIWSKKTNS